MKRMTVLAAMTLAVTGVVGVRSAESAAPRTQVVAATEGMYAHGVSGYVDFPDGSTRWFSAMLVVPGGVVTGSPAVEDADLRKPWAIVSEQSWGDGEQGGGLSGGPNVCHRLVNPTSYSPGHPGDPATWPAAGPQPTWRGVFFDVTCDDGAGYEFYRIHFEPYRSAEDRTAFVRSHRLGARPQTDVRYWGWSTPYRVNGALHAEPKGVQSISMSVCGYRWTQPEDDEEPILVSDCYGSGLGRVIPEVTALTATLYSALEE